MIVVIQLTRYELLRVCASEVVIKAGKVNVTQQPSSFADTKFDEGGK